MAIQTSTSKLADPFAKWAVDLEPAGEDQRVQRLSFTSPVLGRRTENLVWIPAHLSEGDRPVSVVYHLHGTVATTMAVPLRKVVDGLQERGAPVPFLLREPTSAVVHPHTMRFEETLEDHEFILVAPDAAAPPWCLACNWVDGVNGGGVAAERHLHEELFPLVEAIFGARSDRGGRAIIGHSMGGGGALIQAFRHPDRFCFAGSSSGTLSIMDDRTSRTGVRWLLYNRTQGFRPIPVDEPLYRNNNLLDLAANVVGSGMEIVVVAGDGVPTGETRPGPDVPSEDEERRMEQNIRANNDLMVPRLIAQGVPLIYVTRRGVHTIGPSTFRNHLLPRLNEVFARKPMTPARFTYKSVDTHVEIWGWTFEVERATDEFLHVLDGRTDGTGMVLAGSGRVRFHTPARFAPGSEHTVRWTAGSAGDAAVTDELLVADGDGRIAATCTLAPARGRHERRRHLRRGGFALPTVQFEVRD